jgi:hypothetical protein
MKTIKKFTSLDLQVKVLIIGAIFLSTLFTTMILINGFKTF